MTEVKLQAATLSGHYPGCWGMSATPVPSMCRMVLSRVQTLREGRRIAAAPPSSLRLRVPGHLSSLLL